ncbi:MAG: hypothetical protein ACK5N8_07370 [Alphaproteobacteria bacterium]
MGNYYEPFEDVEDVWFWFCSSLLTEDSGWRKADGPFGKERCCETSDIYRIIKKMRQMKQVTNRHLRVAYKWGMDAISPYYDKRAKKSEVKLWIEMMSFLDINFRAKGIL